ncbi:hypothetical protein [Thalassolituus sp. UBA2009]|uniref:hypothetical protein n=1 Tax=Thalassolituus sp. UBA2009 TaxID=1947658 RepID=UPI00257F9CA5|nr:hypothetical protein [Thalassolituus sp. UBA2009]
MSIDLKNSEGLEFDISNIGWAFYLNIAIEYGWKEKGTLPPEGWQGQWNGAYDMSEGQLVSEADAKNMASALETYLEDPNKINVAKAMAKEFEKVGIPVEVDENDKEFLSEYIISAKKSEFRIW